MIKAEDLFVLQELAKVSNLAFKHKIVHYLYFQKRSNASTAVRNSRRSGFEAESGLSVDRSNWQVLIKHQVIPTEEEIDLAIKRITTY